MVISSHGGMVFETLNILGKTQLLMPPVSSANRFLLIFSCTAIEFYSKCNFKFSQNFCMKGEIK